MKLIQPTTVGNIAKLFSAQVIGDPNLEIRHLADVHKVKRGSLIFVDNEKYYEQAIYSSAAAILTDKVLDCPPNKALIIVDNPFFAYNQLAQALFPYRPMNMAISPTAKIGKNTIIEHNVVIGDGVEIGDDCIIRANTTIHTGTIIGNNVVINANAVIGGDAFHFWKDPEDKSRHRWQSIGRVIIHDHVHIGSGCTIDKGVSGDTIIGYGTKIDNQVQIGHGVEIGKHCLIAAQVGISGKSIIQDHVTIYGQVGISKSLVIGEGATLLAQTGVSKSLPGGKTYFGSPATEAHTYFKRIALLRNLPDLLKQHGVVLPSELELDESMPSF